MLLVKRSLSTSQIALWSMSAASDSSDLLFRNDPLLSIPWQFEDPSNWTDWRDGL
jgi:hypothetical protein